MFTANVLYSEAVFYTNAEYENLSGIKIDIQCFIEILELYLLGRWRSNNEELGYVDTRTEYLKDFNVRLQAKDIPIADVIRFFHGDGPAMQFEAGDEKVDHYFCPNCDISYIQTDDINHCYQLPITTLSCKQKKVIDRKYGKENSGQSKTFHVLKKGRISARSVFTIH